VSLDESFSLTRSSGSDSFSLPRVLLALTTAYMIGAAVFCTVKAVQNLESSVMFAQIVISLLSTYGCYVLARQVFSTSMSAPREADPLSLSLQSHCARPLALGDLDASIRALRPNLHQPSQHFCFLEPYVTPNAPRSSSTDAIASQFTTSRAPCGNCRLQFVLADSLSPTDGVQRSRRRRRLILASRRRSARTRSI
jgi:hypothetical protein